MFTFKISFLQELLSEDYPLRLTYAQRIRLELRTDFRYLGRIVLSDECVFHTIGAAQKRNARLWGLVSGFFEICLRFQG